MVGGVAIKMLLKDLFWLPSISSLSRCILRETSEDYINIWARVCEGKYSDGPRLINVLRGVLTLGTESGNELNMRHRPDIT